jgi:predicted dinucleotide-binding enzyme
MTRVRLFWRDAENMTTVGFIGSGQIGSTIARLAIEAGHQVVLSNSTRSRNARGHSRGTAAGIRGDEQGGRGGR